MKQCKTRHALQNISRCVKIIAGKGSGPNSHGLEVRLRRVFGWLFLNTKNTCPMTSRFILSVVHLSRGGSRVKKILVTGGTGFIGSHVAETFLKKGYSLLCLVREPRELAWPSGLCICVEDGESPLPAETC